MTKGLGRLAAAAPALLFAAATLGAEEVVRESISTEYESIRLVKVADNLEHPWGIAFLPDGRLLVTERDGRLNIIEDGEATEVDGVPTVRAVNQGGLMDVVLHPDFESNGWVYLTWSMPDQEGAAATQETATAMGRGRLEGNALVDFETLFVQDRFSSPGRHYGSRIAWAHDGTLYLSIGDRGASPPRAQDLGDHAGTLLRLNDDGTVPEDNPFVGQEDVQPEIFSYGHRNIQGIIVHPDTGAIWVTEHGPRGGDELNLVEAGNNYGWPDVTNGLDYRTQEQFGNSVRHPVEGTTPPQIDWTPSLAPSGLAYVPEDSAFESWQGNLLAGGLRPREIRRIHFIDGEPVHQERLLHQEIGRIRDVRTGPDGNFYVATDNGDDAIYRIELAD